MSPITAERVSLSANEIEYRALLYAYQAVKGVEFELSGNQSADIKAIKRAIKREAPEIQNIFYFQFHLQRGRLVETEFHSEIALENGTTFRESSKVYDARALVDRYCALNGIKNNPIEGQSFLRTSAAKEIKELSYYPVNPQKQLSSVGEDRCMQVTSGALSTHGDFVDKDLKLQCQALALLKASVDNVLENGIVPKIERGNYHFHSTSLLTLRGKEREMLLDHERAIGSLENVQLQFDGGDESITQRAGRYILHFPRQDGINPERLIQVSTSLCTVAVNEQRLLGNDDALQNRINRQGLEKLKSLYPRAAFPNEIRDIEDVRKVNEVLMQNRIAIHTCCKSGKDRTGVQAIHNVLRLLHISGKESLKRIFKEGVRRKICFANIGVSSFAFNVFQRLFTHKSFNPHFPSIVGGATVT